ncbi:uncharacterized protein LOC141781174 isoform X2 [Sebastes fasciatus]|uniref:uncharacterized protein LOC141781174 isoform X2 n=1 Tax=Sebastes fasciatus TaxID=394691 RepID=UPI003D9DB6E7
MDRLFWFSLLLTYLPVTESTKKEESCLIQQHEVGGYIGQIAVLNCTVRSAENCSAEGLYYEWFTYKNHSHIRLNLSSNSHKYILKGAFLHIKSLHTNDSGVYYCAASSGDPAPGAQHVGLGTPLQVHIKRRPILMWALWALFVLLAIYNLAVVILIIKKYGCNMNVGKRMCKTENNSTKKAQFSNVLQEMYSRGNLGGGKNTVSRVQSEAASTDFNCSNDDIYQNV